MGSDASKQAAEEQAAAARQALQLQQTEFNTITGQQQPFMQAGTGALSQLNYLLGIGTPGSAGLPSTYAMGTGITTPGTPGAAASSPAGNYGSLLRPFSLSDWEQLSPGYAFQKQQGTQGVLNANAAGQGALSGSAMKDLIDYNQNLANTSFGDAFNRYQTQQGNIFSRLSGIANLGQSAAANTAQSGVALAGNAGQAAQNVGTALAGGTIGSANAWTGALSSAPAWLAYGGGGRGGGAGSGGYSGGGLDLSDAGIIGNYGTYTGGPG
jgi:hypothetical protein